MVARHILLNRPDRIRPCLGLIVLIAPLLVIALTGCSGIEDDLFPIWEPNFFDESPAQTGPFEINERRVIVPDGADGAPFGITIVEPVDAGGPLPVLMWVMGSNVQAYYHQSLHETLASWGYLVLVPDTRPLRFSDFQYHARIVMLAEQTLDLALQGVLRKPVDPDRLAVGGYSVGAPLATFTAARRSDFDALVYWAPSPAPIWQGLNANALYPQIQVPSLYILGELDDDAPATGGYPDELQLLTPGSTVDELVITGASHHQFQQPTGADEFSNTPTISREEQQAIAIDTTRVWLDETLGIERKTP